MTEGTAYIFINLEQAAGLGHIGWAFQISPDEFYFGSTDHLWRKQYPLWHPFELIRYMDVQPRKNNDFWAQVGNEEQMLTTMRTGRHVRYHEYKKILVTKSKPNSARNLAESMRENGWNLLFNNCVHQSYKILTRYGARELPCPYKLNNRIPKTWFRTIDAETKVLAEPTKLIFATAFEPQNTRRVS